MSAAPDSVEAKPQPPAGCSTKEALDKQQAAEVARIEAKIASMSRPKLGMKPIASASVQLQAAAMREELRIKHENELKQLQEYLDYEVAHPSTTVVGASAAEAEATIEADSDGDSSPDTSADGVRMTKAQRRREKKKAAALEHAASSTSAPSGPTPKEIELKALEKQLSVHSLNVKPIASDGHCMFRAVADQMRLLGLTHDADYIALRKRTADYIRSHAEDFAPFLHYQTTDNFPDSGSGADAVAAVNKYCDRLAATAMWGGHPELRALAASLGVPIVVFQADSLPLRFYPDGEGRGAEDRDGSKEFCMRLSYHKHYYVLGEHYNSVVPTKSS